MNPLSCSAMAKELRKRDEHDDDHRGNRPPGTLVSNFSSTPQGPLPPSQTNVQNTNSTGFVPKKRSCLTETAAMLFDVFSNNTVVKMFLPDGSAISQPPVLKENIGVTAVPGSVTSCDLDSQ